MKTAIVIPTYNEAQNIQNMVDAILELNIPDLHILIVDDNSPDGTGGLADHACQQYPGQVNVLHRTGLRGLGRAYIDGFTWALRNGMDYIIQMDCDFSHSPDYIPTFLEKIRDCDVVIGSRYTSGGKTDEQWQWHRLLLSWWANAVYSRVILGSRVSDITAGFKCWRRETLENIHLDRIHAQGYIFQVEMAYVTEKLGFRIMEIPIFFAERRMGTSKMNMRIKVEAALRLWEIRWRYKGLQPLGKKDIAALRAA